MALTPEAASAPGTMPTPKTTQSTDRKAKRKALKKKHTEANKNATAADADTDATSPPALKVDTSFTMPTGQLTLPDGLVLPPQVFGVTQAAGFDGAEHDEGENLMMMHDNLTILPGNSMTAAFGADTAPMFSSNSTTLFEDFENMFGESSNADGIDFSGMGLNFSNASDSFLTDAEYDFFDNDNTQAQLPLTYSTDAHAAGSQSGK